MAKFRARPIEIEAEQFRSKVLPWPKGVVKSPHGNYWKFNTGGYFATQCAVQDGDWVVHHRNVQEDDPEWSVCKRDVFEATYEAVEGERNGNT